MKIDTKYYGEIDYTKDELVVFPDGLFGFSQYHDYLPLSMEEDDSSMLILQSVRFSTQLCFPFIFHKRI